MQFNNKKLLILGGNPETIPLVLVAQKMGIEVYLTDDNPNSAAKKFTNKSFNVNGLNVEGIIQLAINENVDGVLVGVADILVKSYVKVCEALNFPCYATEELSNIFSHKDFFKQKIGEVTTIAIPIGIGLIALSWIMTGIYTYWANNFYDKEVEEIKKKL